MDEVDEELAELAELDNLSNKSSACDCPAHVHDREFPLEIAKVGLKDMKQLEIHFTKNLYCSMCDVLYRVTRQPSTTWICFAHQTNTATPQVSASHPKLPPI